MRTQDEKIEIRLEPKQVISLGFGTMVMSSILFSAGYVVGQRGTVTGVQQAPAIVESAAKEVPEALEAEPPETVKAALGEVEFLFPNALGSRPARSAKKAWEPNRAKGPQRRDPVKKTKRLVPEKSSEPVVTNTTPKALTGSSMVVAASRTPKDIVPSRMGDRPSAPAKPVAHEATPPTEKKVTPVRTPLVAKNVNRVPGQPNETGLTPVTPSATPVKAPRSLSDSRPRKAESRLRSSVSEDTPRARKAGLATARKAASQAYTVQVKAVRSKAESDAFMADLRSKGYSPHVVLVDLPKKGRFYRIRIGRFTSREAAKRFQRRFKKATGGENPGFITRL